MLSHTNFWAETENPQNPPYIYSVCVYDSWCSPCIFNKSFTKCIDKCISPFVSLRGDSGKDWQRQRQSFQRQKRRNIQDGYAQDSPGKDKPTNLHSMWFCMNSLVLCFWTSFNGRFLKLFKSTVAVLGTLGLNLICKVCKYSLEDVVLEAETVGLLGRKSSSEFPIDPS